LCRESVISCKDDAIAVLGYGILEHRESFTCQPWFRKQKKANSKSHDVHHTASSWLPMIRDCAAGLRVRYKVEEKEKWSRGPNAGMISSCLFSLRPWIRVPVGEAATGCEEGRNCKSCKAQDSTRQQCHRLAKSASYKAKTKLNKTSHPAENKTARERTVNCGQSRRNALFTLLLGGDNNVVV
jgi:hypothetical protein